MSIGLLIMSAVGLFLVTYVVGGVWCGFTARRRRGRTCPCGWNAIEGDRHERVSATPDRFRSGPSGDRQLKHAAWPGIGFWTGGAWIMDYVDAPTVTVEFWTGAASTSGVFPHLPVHRHDLPAGRLGGAQALPICAGGRDSSRRCRTAKPAASYQGGAANRACAAGGMRPTPAATASSGCRRHSGPTGIDIRDGIEMERISCGSCIDA